MRGNDPWRAGVREKLARVKVGNHSSVTTTAAAGMKPHTILAEVATPFYFARQAAVKERGDRTACRL